MENPYQQPLADLEGEKRGVDAFKAFERFSTWWVFLLGIVTLSFYLPFWMYTRTQVLNRLPGVEPIGDEFVVITVVLYILAEINGLSGLFRPDKGVLDLTSQVVSMASNILFLVWVFKFKNRLNDFLEKNVSGYMPLTSMATFFMQVIYLSFKLNQHLDMVEHQA